MKKSLLLIMLIFAATIVSADTVDFRFNDLQEKVSYGTEAEFIGNIKNNDDVGHEFRFVVENSDWVLGTSPKILYVPADSSKDFEITFTPLSPKKSGTYGITVSAISNEDNSIRAKRTFDVTYVDYKDFFDVEVNFPSSFDPSTNNIAKITIKNNENIDLNNLNVMLQSKYFNGELKDLDLSGNSQATYNMNLNFESGYKEGTYNVDVLVNVNEKEIFSKEAQAQIDYIPLDSEVKSPESGFLLTKTDVTKRNEGDIVVEDTYSKKLGYFEKLFTSYNVQPDSINQVTGGYIAEWDIELSPGESENIQITTDYRMFAFTIFVLVILTIVVVTLVRRDLSVSKNVVSLVRGKEGVSTFSVMLHVKNKSRSTLRNVRVMDTVYNLQAHDEVSHSMLKPKMVKKSANSARYVWELQKVEPNAEINISYDVKTHERKAPTMFGSAALARYISKTGKWKDVSSKGKI